ncbi:Gfo/Idh/MocA family oxidoreductase [Flaviaesturariibacter flavus]|uniref:Gfo/Idh/MocA family oxidoreductase n=1 Tax=Flaviaesturariibacter flavus TaxID=2502780 RepID=A0A4R1BB66_9BACT|nr:Gfo/Idh/MocA family oxidoreductase [Flaviaesturariibacter flavus]TCJ14235.1 Gfo/Idh/MocA family oxidoreductase [Flaviaesturariibacter flavus]
MAEKISWGIIGCGDVTEVKSGPAFNRVPQSRLYAVMRRNGAKAADYAARHGVPKWYDDAAALISDPEVNAVYIATPPSSHAAYTLQALAAGKPVYVEKPMALDAGTAQLMATAAQEAGLPLCVAHYRRAQPLFQKIKSLLEEDAIGRPRNVRLELFEPAGAGLVARTEQPWRLDPAISGGGLFYDLAPHALDLLLYFFGTPVSATGASWNAAGQYAADDTTAGIIRFEGNVLFEGSWCFAHTLKRDVCTIYGSEGSLRFSVFENRPVLLDREGTQAEYRFEPLAHVQEPMIAAVTQHFLGLGPNPSPAQNGVAVQELMESFTRKAGR